VATTVARQLTKTREKPLSHWIEYTDSMQDSLNTMFGVVFRGADFEVQAGVADDKARRKKLLASFRTQFAENIFQDEFALLYEVAFTNGLTDGSWGQIRGVLDANRDVVLRSGRVNHDSFRSVNQDDEEEFETICDRTRTLFEVIITQRVPSAEVFRTAQQSFILEYRKLYGEQIFQNGVAILTSDVANAVYVDYQNGKRRAYEGVDDSFVYVNNELSKLTVLGGSNENQTFVIDDEYIESISRDKTQAARSELLVPKIGIPGVDDYWDGFRRGRMYSIMGPPKGGKTSFSAYLAYRLLMAGKNVAVWAMEGSVYQWEAKIISAMCAHSSKMPKKLNLSGIQHGSLSGEDEVLVKKARAELAGHNLGTLSFIGGSAYIEDFLGKVKSHYENENEFDCIIFDSLVNVQSRTGRNKSERLSEAFMTAKDYIENKMAKPAAAIVTVQIKQDELKSLRGKVNPEIDVLAGGETSETVRTPDEVLALYATADDKAASQAQLQHVASRHSAQFSPVPLRVDYGCLIYEQLGI
jgi:archaellum biogenesis ATPase FlaH